jgi:predicted enzyme related to lactoylglutathione lyase
MSDKLEVGAIGWIDLTVLNAKQVRDFYSGVIGWKPEEVPMGDYSDYNMTSPESGTPSAGICHKRGVNANLPSQWMAYFIVADMKESLTKVSKLGGKIIIEPKTMGEHGSIAVIEDPAGAVCALFEQA